ncbi:MAG: bifunctional DNA primase/polymerase, partial [Anaerolineae bacterium]|nr:bifunctional DNA primase/polymerase [Anaerolineae bacterium]
MNSNQIPPIVQAAQSGSIYEAAQGYTAQGMRVISLNGKRPALNGWKEYQQHKATATEIEIWHKNGLLENIGIVCGEVSDNLVVLDLDGAAGYPAFAATFPHLAQTYTVATGGGVGKHVYFRVDTLPPSVKAMNTPIGNLELCGEGRQVVA